MLLIGISGCEPESPAPATNEPAEQPSEHAGHDHDEGEHGEVEHGEGASHDHGHWWCAEHGVPEDVCTRCKASLISRIPRGKRIGARNTIAPTRSAFIAIPSWKKSLPPDIRRNTERHLPKSPTHDLKCSVQAVAVPHDLRATPAELLSPRRGDEIQNWGEGLVAELSTMCERFD